MTLSRRSLGAAQRSASSSAARVRGPRTWCCGLPMTPSRCRFAGQRDHLVQRDHDEPVVVAAFGEGDDDMVGQARDSAPSNARTVQIGAHPPADHAYPVVAHDGGRKTGYLHSRLLGGPYRGGAGWGVVQRVADAVFQNAVARIDL